MDVSSMAPANIWEEKERPQTLADKSFAPTSITGVEFPDDIEPDMYRANRAAMEANGRDELNELMGLNHRTTAYPTLSCTSGPMSPIYRSARPCDLDTMNDVSHGITAYTRHGQPLLPQFNVQRAAQCGAMAEAGVGIGAPNPQLVTRASGEPPIGYGVNSYFRYGGDGEQSVPPAAPTKKKTKKSRFKHMGVRMMNSARGTMYDLRHFSDLPPAQSGESPTSVTWYTMTRNNRLPYLLLLLIMILVLVSVVLGLKSASKRV